MVYTADGTNWTSNTSNCVIFVKPTTNASGGAFVTLIAAGVCDCSQIEGSADGLDTVQLYIENTSGSLVINYALIVNCTYTSATFTPYVPQLLLDQGNLLTQVRTSPSCWKVLR